MSIIDEMAFKCTFGVDYDPEKAKNLFFTVYKILEEKAKKVTEARSRHKKATEEWEKIPANSTAGQRWQARSKKEHAEREAKKAEQIFHGMYVLALKFFTLKSEEKFLT